MKRRSLNDIQRWRKAVEITKRFPPDDLRAKPRHPIRRRRAGHRLAILAKRRRAMPLTPEQQELAYLMSDMSESLYFAGWLCSWEYTVWATLHGEGDEAIAEDDQETLRRMSQEIGGWISSYRDVGEIFVPLDQWQGMYAAWKQQGRS